MTSSLHRTFSIGILDVLMGVLFASLKFLSVGFSARSTVLSFCCAVVKVLNLSLPLSWLFLIRMTVTIYIGLFRKLGLVLPTSII